jgi:hypothetical protein
LSKSSTAPERFDGCAQIEERRRRDRRGFLCRRLDFFVDFEFKSRILRRVIELVFHEAVRRMVAAFEHGAQRLDGTPAPEGAGKAAV